ncbi:hypothetical protein QE109_02145 [Fusibacter bizertensis]|uniref:Uncharacterized protein n=1 Tax=Fusibacter bizertensis TaxID=1488331 RepID=A0ABT6N928_9FIRM|nr:hypothetical protein [Fusibacter bizertensis]MDH8676927.1 hypothetical protein [Fusibacter bizertensis]
MTISKFFKAIHILEAVIILFVLCSCSAHDVGENIDIVYNEDGKSTIESNVSTESANTDIPIEEKDNTSIDKNERDTGRTNDIYQIELHMEQIGSVHYGTGYEGGTDLENGITFLFAVFDGENTDELSWLKTWNNIDISELDYYSGVSVTEDKILMAVNDTLYSLYIENGAIDWQLDHIGYPSMPPIIDDAGNIYLVCERKPYLSIINKNGIIESQLYSDQLYGIQDLYFENDLLIAKIYTETYEELIIENIDDFKE